MTRSTADQFRPLTEELDPAIIWDAETLRVRVKDGMTGYYNHLRRREGEVFTLYSRRGIRRDTKTQQPIKENGKTVEYVITPAEQFSDRWMELVDESVPLSEPSTAQDAINIANNITRAEKRARA